MNTYICHAEWTGAPLQSSMPISAETHDEAAIKFINLINAVKSSMRITVTWRSEKGPPEMTIVKMYRIIAKELYVCKPNWSPTEHVKKFRDAPLEGNCQEIW